MVEELTLSADVVDRQLDLRGASSDVRTTLSNPALSVFRGAG
jgi:hypothetical protein